MIEALVGTWVGEGTTHEGERFTGRLIFLTVAEKHGVAVSFSARGGDGEIFYKQYGLIADDKFASVDNRVAGMTMLTMRQSEPGKFCVFGMGKRDDASSYRLEITLEIHSDHEIAYRFAWGMPGGEFHPRSGLLLKRVAS
ncbi:MAG: hypothetical protein O7E54_08455 [Planctomycetota bacterium]|nr:hypothetical protein [Planctomycetota bacterium]